MDAQSAFSSILAVESSAKQLASRVSCLLESLKWNLTTASNCSREYIDLYQASVSQTCNEADASIRVRLKIAFPSSSSSSSSSSS
ncbi:unnamed protein product, partial [Dibothriocephalus latus]